MGQDESTTVAALRKQVQRFVTERNWQTYHQPKDLAVAIAVEAAELLELFQWRTELRPEDLPTLQQEMADILIYLLSLSNALSIDLAGAVADKMKVNETRYPAHTERGW